MKLLKCIFVFLFCTLPAQHNSAFDSLKLKDVKDLMVDDYGNIYLYKNNEFSFTKYDSVGNQKGKQMLTLPFKIQSVQNPLNIPSFSENAQELKFYDQNLNEIQTVNFRQKFVFVKMVYAEDLQQIWLLEETTKRLIQYNFREDKIIGSFPFDIDFDKIKDFLVFNNQVYIIRENHFSVYTFRSERLLDLRLEDGRRLRRENKNIFVIGSTTIHHLKNGKLDKIFAAENSQIVDKNSAAYFVISANKLYLYPLNK